MARALASASGAGGGATADAPPPPPAHAPSAGAARTRIRNRRTARIAPPFAGASAACSPASRRRAAAARATSVDLVGRAQQPHAPEPLVVDELAHGVVGEVPVRLVEQVVRLEQDRQALQRALVERVTHLRVHDRLAAHQLLVDTGAEADDVALERGPVAV